MARKQKGKNREVSPTAPAQTTSTSLSLTDTTPRPQAVTLLEDNFRVLLCLIEGDSTVFQVKAPINNNVLDLKDLIREKGINVQERYVLAKDLLLLKVSTTSTTVSPHSRAEVVALAGRCRSQRQ
jgi:hypothetical protein